MKIIHVISSLDRGGAERVLFNICVTDKHNEHIVISLTSLGHYGQLLKKKNFTVYVCNMRSKIYMFLSFLNLIRILKKQKPDLVQTWLYHGDFFGGIAAKIAGIRKIVWNIRNTSLNLKKNKWTTIIIVKILAKLSWWVPQLIIVCAKSAIASHVLLGYNQKKMCLIHNGYDLSFFKKTKNKNFFMHKLFDINPQIPLIGTVARFNFQKDHENLFKALVLLKKKKIEFYSVLVGHDMDQTNIKLVSLIKKYQITDLVKLLGLRDDIPNIMNEIDVHVLSSSTEGFPNVVAEAMACGTPCIVTDVGESAFIVGNTGWVVPPKRPELLSNSINEAILHWKTNQWKLRISQAKSRIKENFNINNTVKSYRKIWNQIR